MLALGHHQGGTADIQRNIVGKLALRLQKESADEATKAAPQV
jgi:hypothetical protein